MFTSTQEAVKMMHLEQLKLQELRHKENQLKIQTQAISKEARRSTRQSIRLQWMNEFSDVGSEMMSTNTIHILKAGSRAAYLNYKEIEE